MNSSFSVHQFKPRQSKQLLGILSDSFTGLGIFQYCCTVSLLCSVFSMRLHGLMLMPALFRLLQDLQGWAVDVALPLIIY